MPRSKSRSRSKRRKPRAQNEAGGGSESSEAATPRPSSAQSVSSSVDDGSISIDVVTGDKRDSTSTSISTSTNKKSVSNACSSRPTQYGKNDDIPGSKTSKINDDSQELKLDLDLSSSVDAIRLKDNPQKTVESEVSDESHGCAVGGKAQEDKDGASASDKKDSDYYDDDYYYDYDDSSDEEEKERDDRREMRECLTCGKTSREVKKCGGCGYAAYCDKKCQEEGWKKGHKKLCAKYKLFSSKLSEGEFQGMMLKHGRLEKRISIDYFRRANPGMLGIFLDLQMVMRPKQCVIVEIVDRHPHFFRPGCIVQDADGKRTQILFYTTPIILVNVGGFNIIPVNLKQVLNPGKFLCLIDPTWHYFLDGTVGIRIDDHDEYELL